MEAGMLSTHLAQRWFLPGPGAGYLVVSGGAHVAGAGARVSPTFAAMSVKGWLSSSPWVMDEIYETLGGDRCSGLSITQARQRREQVERRLAEAFRAGTLVALKVDLPVPELRTPKPAPEPEPIEDAPVATSKIVIELVGEDDSPVPGERYRVVLPDRSIREGRLDSRGCATLLNIPSGPCKVTFPNLDEEAWELIEAVAA
jgi:hypothetical protein